MSRPDDASIPALKEEIPGFYKNTCYHKLPTPKPEEPGK